MTKASDNVFPKVILGPLGAPTAPADASWKLYPMADGVYARSSNASVGPLGAAGVGGSVATDAIWDAAGDLAVGTGANTAARLAIGATDGMSVRRVTGAVAWALPPGHELDYVEITSNVSVTATTEGTATTVITSSSVTFDGAAVILEFFSSGATPRAATAGDLSIVLRDDTAGTVIGVVGYLLSQAANQRYTPVLLRRRFTPAAGARVYSIRAFADAATSTILAGAGGSGAYMPAYLRITKV